MIRLFVAVALFLALHPAARPLPRSEQARVVALDAPQPRLALPDVNSSGSALPPRFTLMAPAALLLAPAPLLVAACGSRRWLWSSRLLL